MALVHTPHGLGEIVETQSFRGKTQHRVAGRGFDVWVDSAKCRTAGEFSFGPMLAEQEKARKQQQLLPVHGTESFGEYTAGLGDVNDGNSTTLPYDPTPQHSWEAAPDAGTWAPGGETGDVGIDADERLQASDSLSGDSRGNQTYPAPSPDNFAKSSAYYSPRLANVRPRIGIANRYIALPEAEDHSSRVAQWRRDPLVYLQRRAYQMASSLPVDLGDYGSLIEADAQLRTAAWKDVVAKAKRLRDAGRVIVHDVTPQRIYATVEGDHGTYETMILKSAGQSISDWHCDCEWGRWAFKRQFTYVGRLCSHGYAAHLEMGSANQKGNAGKFRRMTAGDNGPSVGNADGSLSQFKNYIEDQNYGYTDQDAVDNYVALVSPDDVSADQVSKLRNYVEDNHTTKDEGDLYEPATELTARRMQSPGLRSALFRTAADDDDVKVLRTNPQSLTPNLVEVEHDDDDAQYFCDVEKDERDTTAPEGIVHFSHVDAMGNPYSPTGFWRTAETPGLDDLLGVPAPAGDTLETSPFAGGDFNPAAIPGVSGGPNTPATSAPDAYPGTTPGTASPGGGVGGPSAPTGSSDPQAFGGGASPADPTGGMMTDALDAADAPATSATNASGVTPGGAGSAGTGLGAGSGGGGWGMGSAGDGAGSPGAGGGTDATGSPTGGGSGWSPNGNTDAIGQGEYTIQQGDTLSDIADRSGYGGDYQSLADANNIADPDVINAGDKINIGSPGGGAAPADDLGGAPDATGATGGGAGTGVEPFGTGGVQPDAGGGADVQQSFPDAVDPGLTDPASTAGVDPVGMSVPDDGKQVTGRRFLAEEAEDDESKKKGLPADPMTNPTPGPEVGKPPAGQENNPSLTNPVQPVAVGSDNASAQNTPGGPAPAPESAPPGASAGPAEAPEGGGDGGGLGGFDMGQAMGLITPIVEGIGQFAGPIGDAVGGALSGLGGAGGALSGISGIFSAKTAENISDSLLEKLRDLTDEGPGDNLGHMDSYNDQVRDTTDKLHDQGVNASPIVAGRWRGQEADPYEGGVDPVDYAIGSDGPDDPNYPFAKAVQWHKDNGTHRRGTHRREAEGGFLGQGDPDWMNYPFNGSGPDPKDWYGTSEDYLKDEIADHEDVTDLPTGPTGKADKPQQKASRQAMEHRPHFRQVPFGEYEGEDATGNDEPNEWWGANDRAEHAKQASIDPVANFYRSGAADALRHNSSADSGGGQFSDAAIAERAQAFLKTAGRVYSPQEQRELMAENHPLGARNRPTDEDLAGTHYIL